MLPIQRNLIWGLGRGIYGMFGQKLLKKTKRVRNPHGNKWNRTNTTAIIAADGLQVSNEIPGYPNVFSEQPFFTSGPLCRMDGFPGTICYYYEVKGHLHMGYVGLSDDANPDNDNLWTGEYTNSYAIPTGYYNYECWLAGEVHDFELPEGAIRPDWDWKDDGTDVFGCGLVLDPEDNLAIFFTLNGKLLGRKIQISPTVDCLFPTVTVRTGRSFEANFGNFPAKPFEYDIQNCPGLELACI